MSSSRDALRRQRRRELDARRSKSRVRLGACLKSWGQLKERLGFALHSELAQYLLESYFSKVCVKCSGGGREVKRVGAITTSSESLQRLVLQVHLHGQCCPFPPSLQPEPVTGDEGQASTSGEGIEEQSKKDNGGQSRDETDSHLEALPTGKALLLHSLEKGGKPDPELCLRYICQEGHLLSWCPSKTGREEVKEGSRAKEGKVDDATPAGAYPPRERGRRGLREVKRESTRDKMRASERRRGEAASVVAAVERGQPRRGGEDEEAIIDLRAVENGENETPAEMYLQPELPNTGSDLIPTEPLQPKMDCRKLPDEEEKETEDLGSLPDKDTPPSKCDPTVIQRKTTRGRQKKTVLCGESRPGARISKRHSNRRTPRGLADDDISQIGGKRKRKATPRDILPCEFDGCGKIFSSRQYLNHHMKYQHFHQKTFTCSHPTCGKSFNFKKHLKEHEKLHSNQRDYICEYCARAFRTSSSLVIHRRIHTGEKPLQCEVCGFTCRQKSSLNWHMRKHNAESSYQFPCEICGRRFEKRDNVTAHRSKSHPDQTQNSSAVSAVPSPENPSLSSKQPTPSRASSNPAQSTDHASPSTDHNKVSIVVI
ncbi:hypothetical protein AGOR_G00145690 [Albula goreensis]|uniref:C2H2-type domain-containing protein n=1 Tax=Albula goreensis TaxID=1534307 RepID=A0A8T3D1W0_9TELE|nr:hypothetical protein AGOR_G00145690 [Albula goreensis]